MKFNIEADNHTSKQSNEQDGTFSTMSRLLELGISLVDQDLQIMPMGRTKKPNWRFIPKDATDQFRWSLFFAQNPASSVTPQTVEHWLNCGSVGLSLHTGKVTVFDIDVPEYLGLWMEDEAVNEIIYRINAPIQLTGGGGYQIPLIVDVPDDQKPKSRPLSFIPDESKASGRTVTIELKGVGSYAMLPFSRHPSGNLYEPLDWFGGSFASIPTITHDEYEALVSAAKALCKAPKSRQTLQREERMRRAKAEQAKRPKRVYSNEKVSVIDQFNDRTDIEDMLNRYGYEQVGVNRYSCPNSKHGSDVRITPDNASIHYSSYDNLEGKQTPFNLVCHFEHGDDIREAVKAIAEELGQDYASQYREEIRAKQQARPAQQAPQPAQQVPQHAPPCPTSASTRPTMPNEPDFGSPPPSYDEPTGYEPIGYGPTEYDQDEPSYDDLLASCGVLEPVAPTLPDKPNAVTRNPQVREFVPNTPNTVKLTFEYDDYVEGLSDFAVQAMKNHGKRYAIVCAPTGTGKSTDAIGHNRVIFAPTQPITRQIKQKGAFAVMEGVHAGEIPPYMDSGLVATYNSALRATSELKEREMIDDETRSHVDEIHHILTDGGFRLRALSNVIKATEYFSYNILMSATPFSDILSRTIFKNCVIIDVVCSDLTRNSKKVSSFYVDSHDDVSLIVQLHEQKPSDIQILHANDKAYLAEIAKVLNEKFGGAYLFTGDTKEEPHHVAMIDHGFTPEDCRFILTTNLYNDGISLLPQNHNVIISSKSRLLAEEIQQVIARQRVGKNMIKPSAVFVMKREAADKPVDMTSSLPLDVVAEFEQTMTELGQTILTLGEIRFQMLNAKSETTKGVLRQALDRLLGGPFIEGGKTYDDPYTINQIAVLNSIMDRKRMSMSTGQLVSEMIATDEFMYCGEYVVNTLLFDKTVRELTALAKADKKEAAKEQMINLFEAAEGPEGIKALEHVASNPNDFDKPVRDATIAALMMWRDVEKLGGKLGGLLGLIKDKKAYSASKLKTLRHQIQLSVIFTLLSTNTVERLADDAQALLKLRSLIQDDDKLGKDEIDRIRAEMATHSGGKLVGKWDTTAKATRSIKRLFDTKRGKSGPKGNQKHVTVIKGTYKFDQSLQLKLT